MKIQTRFLVSVVLFMFAVGFSSVVFATDVASDPTASYMRDLYDGPRFSRDSNGVIFDHKTGLQWLEGPDVAVNWYKAQEWVGGLKDGWRSPTVDEMSGIYIPNSNRMGGVSETGKGPYPLMLDPVFKLDKAYSVWCEPCQKGTAFVFLCSWGDAYESLCEMTRWPYRAFAVRNRR